MSLRGDRLWVSQRERNTGPKIATLNVVMKSLRIWVQVSGMAVAFPTGDVNH